MMCAALWRPIVEELPFGWRSRWPRAPTPYPELMSLNVRRFGCHSGQPIVFVPGFGDHGGMFEALGRTVLGDHHAILGVDLPGTGFSSPLEERLTLPVAADLVADVVRQEEAEIIAGHSVGSAVASLAAQLPSSSIRTVLSIEGNLTPADAYFSGSAAGYESPSLFHAAFLARLDEMARDSPTIQRYREQVAAADPRSIWELGCDVAEWSRSQQPGDVLARSAERVRYLFNPDNTPAESLDPLATVALLRLSPGPDFASRVAFRLEPRSDATADGVSHALLLFPSLPLDPGGRYGLVVTTRVRAASGKPFRPSPFLWSCDPERS